MTDSLADAKVYRSELNPVDFLARAAYMYPERQAMIDGERRFTYAQLAERSWRLANVLQAAGSQGRSGRDLAVQLRPMLEAHFAIPAAAGVMVAINNRLSGPEVGYILNHSGARFLLVDSELEPLLADHELGDLTVIRYVAGGGPDDQYEPLLAGASPEIPPSQLEHEEETISINYTSGTTGRPRVCVHLSRRVSERAQRGDPGRDRHRLRVPLDASDVPLQRVVLPVGGHLGGGLPRFAAHARPRTDLGSDRRRGRDPLHGAPTVQLMVINHPRAHRLDKPVTAMVAAAPPSPTLFARMGELGFKIVHVYGLTETYGPTTVAPDQPAWSDLHSTSARSCSLARARRTSRRT